MMGILCKHMYDAISFFFIQSKNYKHWYRGVVYTIRLLLGYDGLVTQGVHVFYAIK
jgi:hypothetical protein